MADQIERKHFVPHVAISPSPATLIAIRDRSRAAASEDCGRLLTSYTIWMPWFFSGNERMRLPVAAKYAFSTAGAATQTVGSPTPPQKPPEGMMIDSILGICAMRIES